MHAGSNWLIKSMHCEIGSGWFTQKTNTWFPCVGTKYIGVWRKKETNKERKKLCQNLKGRASHWPNSHFLLITLSRIICKIPAGNFPSHFLTWPWLGLEDGIMPDSIQGRHFNNRKMKYAVKKTPHDRYRSHWQFSIKPKGFLFYFCCPIGPALKSQVTYEITAYSDLIYTLSNFCYNHKSCSVVSSEFWKSVERSNQKALHGLGSFSYGPIY